MYVDTNKCFQNAVLFSQNGFWLELGTGCQFQLTGPTGKLVGNASSSPVILPGMSYCKAFPLFMSYSNVRRCFQRGLLTSRGGHKRGGFAAGFTEKTENGTGWNHPWPVTGPFLCYAQINHDVRFQHTVAPAVKIPNVTATKGLLLYYDMLGALFICRAKIKRIFFFYVIW